MLLSFVFLFSLTACVQSNTAPEVSVKPGVISFDGKYFEARLNNLGQYGGEDEIFTRRNPYPTNSIIPADYGLLYPYTGRYTYPYGGVSASEYAKKGLVDAQGGIVLDAVFDRIYPIYKDAYPAESMQEKPDAYILQYAELENENEEVGYFEKKNVIYIADSSGKWVIGPYENVRQTKVGKIFVMRDKKWGVADFDGNEVVECKYQQAVAGDGFDPYMAAMSANCGILQIQRSSDTQSDDANYVINTDGEIIFERNGVYPQELDNCFIVKNAEGLYGLMLPDGKWQLEPQHNFLSVLDDKYICFSPNYDSEYPDFGIMDKFGNVLIDAFYTFITVDDNAYYLSFGDYDYNEPKDETTGLFLDENLKTLKLNPGFKLKYFYPYSDYCLWQGPEGLVLSDWKCEKLYPVSDENSVRYVTGSLFVIGDELINLSTGKAEKIPETSYAYELDDNYYVISDGFEKLRVFKMDGTQALPEVYGGIAPLYGGYFSVSQGHWEGIVDSDGKWILKLSMQKYYPD